MAKKKSNVSTTTPAAALSTKPNGSAGRLSAIELKPSQEQIRWRAYELYCKRAASGMAGTPDGDWQQAERELTRA
ncbi:MAG: DUF2934 domain-containing protein [Phycisphaerales bacterium]|nr:DUF2934 domain-containing protein [Phycisphaerales bacterium]